MEVNFTDDDISTFYRMLIELGGFHTVDDSPDKYVREKQTGDIAYMTTSDGVNKNVAIYGSKSSDAVVINPLAEGDSESAINSWFMSTCNTTLGGRIYNIMYAVLKVGVESHKKNKKKGEEENNLKLVELLGKDAEAVDEKMLKELEQLTHPLKNFFNIHYNRNTRQGEVKCPIFTEAQRKSFPSIRVKTWEVFKHILGRILGTEDLNEFSYKPGTIGVPTFESFANILVRIYKALTESLAAIDVAVEHIPELESHLKYLPQYYAKAKWCVTPQADQVPAAPQPHAVAVAPTPWVAPPQVPAAAPVVPTPAFGAPVPQTAPVVPVGYMAPQPYAAPALAPVAPVFGGMQPMNTAAPAPSTGANSNNPFARA